MGVGGNFFVEAFEEGVQQSPSLSFYISTLGVKTQFLALSHSGADIFAFRGGHLAAVLKQLPILL